MKKYVILVLFAILLFAVCGILTACEDPNGEVPTTHEHKKILVERVDPTCTQGGNTAYYKCDGCDKFWAENGKTEIGISDTLLQPLNHNFQDGVCTRCGEKQSEVLPCMHENAAWEETTAATCLQTGVKKKICPNCTTVLAEEEIPMIPHNYVDGFCSVCGAGEPIELCTHESSHLVVDLPSTCTEEGVQHLACDSCGATLQENIPLAKIPHVEELIPEKPATCLDGGFTSGKKCSACGTTLVEPQPVAATGHSDLDRNCLCDSCNIPLPHDDADSNCICDRCGATLEHNPESIPEQPATCIAVGWTEGSRCSVCGTVIVSPQEVPRSNHTMGEWAMQSPATCTEAEVDVRNCTVCGKNEETTDVGVPLGHDNVACVCTRCGISLPHNEITVDAIEPTCTEDGWTEGLYCDHCNTFVKKQDVIPAFGHSESDWVVDGKASCTAEGSRHTYCTVCEETVNVEKLPMLPHSWDDKFCTVCEMIDSPLLFDVKTSDDGVTYTVTALAPGAEELSEIVIPDTIHNLPVTTISENLLYGNSNVKKLTVGKNIVNIGMQAFNCPVLSEVNWHATACQDFFGDDNPFLDAGMDGDGFVVNICANVQKIPNFLFSRRPSNDFVSAKVKSVVFAEGCVCKEIGYSAFAGSTSLQSVYVDDLEFWINLSFANKMSNPLTYAHKLYVNGELLTEFATSSQATTVGAYVFSGCDTLQKVTIGESIVSIGAGAFDSCTALTEINFNAVECGAFAYSDNVFAFAGKNSDGIVLNIGAKATTIPENSFGGNYFNTEMSANIVEIVFAENSQCRSIGNSAFYGCNGLAELKLPDSVEELGTWAFYKCKTLTSVVLSSSLNKVESYVFAECALLQQVVVPNGTTMLGMSMFAQCPSLSDVKFGSGLVNIESYAFYNCVSLLHIFLPDTLENLGGRSFDSCTALSAIVIPDSVKNIGGEAFSGCSSLLSITVGRGVTNIGGRAFCTGGDVLEEINFNATECADVATSSEVFRGGNPRLIVGANVKVIPAYMFKESSLISVSFEKDSLCERIGASAFMSCKNLVRIIIPENIKSMEENAFANCDSLAFIDYRAINCDDRIAPLFYRYGDVESTIKLTIAACVEHIPAGAFSDCRLASVVFEKDSCCQSIGERAFYGRNIQSIVLPDGVEQIGKEAFYYCSKLEEIVVPASATQFGENAFASAANITAPAAAFAKISDSKFHTVHIVGDGEIGNRLFARCITLTSVIIDDSVKVIGNEAFVDCKALSEVNFGRGLESIGEFAFSGTNITSITIPENVKSIGTNAFANCSVLAEVNFNAIACDSNGIWLDSGKNADGIVVNIGAKVQYLAPMAFNNAYVKEVNFAEGSVCTVIGERTFQSCKIQEIHLPAAITTIGDSAFSYCTKLTDIVLPESVQSIGAHAFAYCVLLASVTIPQSLREIGINAFNACERLSILRWNAAKVDDFNFQTNLFSNVGKEGAGLTVIFGSAVRRVPAYMFCCGSVNLKEVIFEENSVCTSVGESAFQSCYYLEHLDLPDTIEEFSETALTSCTSLKYLEYDNALYLGNAHNPCVVLVKAKDRNITSCEIGSGTKVMLTAAFSECKLLTKIAIPEAITVIPKKAFYNCQILQEVTLSSRTEVICEEAFYSCSKLPSIIIPSTVTEIQARAFSGCGIANVYITDIEAWCKIDFADSSSTPVRYSGCNLIVNGDVLTELVVPQGITEIKPYAFKNMTCLTSVRLPEGVSVIGQSAFVGCGNLQEVFLPATLRVIEDSAFESCGIASVQFPSQLETIGTKAFMGCYRISQLFVPASVSEIGVGTFAGCNLESISVHSGNVIFGSDGNCLVEKDTNTLVLGCKNSVIPNYVKAIGESAFESCSGLVNLTLAENILSIGKSAFKSCRELQHISIADSIQTIGVDAFRNCSKISYTQLDGLHYLGNAQNPYLVLAKADSSVTECVVHEDTKFILSEAFSRKNSLKSVVIGDNVVEIGEQAFASCYSLTSITMGKNVLRIGNNAFSGCSVTDVYAFDVASWCKINFASSTANPLSNAENFYVDNQLTTDLVVPQEVSSIGDWSFVMATMLQSVTLPNNITIGKDSFARSGINQLTLGKNTIIGERAFFSCTELITVNIKQGTIIGDEAFYKCRGIYNLTFEDGYNGIVIGERAFMECNSFFTLELDNVISIGSQAFAWDNINSVVITTVTREIADDAFYKCDMLLTATVPTWALTKIPSEYVGTLTVDGGAEILQSDMKGYNVLTWVVIGNSVTSIGEDAFSAHSSLVVVELGSNVKTIGARAFAGCWGMLSLTIPEGVVSIGDDAFGNMQWLELPLSIQSLGENLPFCKNIGAFYYNGTAEDWAKVQVAGGSSDVLSDRVYFYSETDPYADGADPQGKYWHWNEDHGSHVEWKK